MHRLIITVALVLLCTCCALEASGSCSIEGFVPIDSIDLKKALTSDHTSFVIHALQPTQEAIRAKKYTGPLDTEVNELQRVLRKVLREEYLPSEAALRANRIGLVDLWGGNDYLLVSYTTKSGLRIDIKDGKLLYLLLTMRKREEDCAADFSTFIRKVAAEVFALPQVKLESTEWPKIAVSACDVGRSKVGTITYGSALDWDGPDWYTNILWWSDGKRVLFQISKCDFQALSTKAGPPADLGVPRKFSSRVTSTAK
ncbi:MAG: hypothetical protein K6T99_00050 [Armatimonadetes bacterium]|nr:hypothetical protein [Armatimonadota bacterium]